MLRLSLLLAEARRNVKLGQGGVRVRVRGWAECSREVGGWDTGGKREGGATRNEKCM